MSGIETLESLSGINAGTNNTFVWCSMNRARNELSAPPAWPWAFSSLEKPVKARINHSRWIADCPWCDGAELVSKIECWFWCTACGMEEHGRLPLRVKFPVEAEQIEQILMDRPNKKHRNWVPGETINDLLRENVQHGIAIQRWSLPIISPFS